MLHVVTAVHPHLLALHAMCSSFLGVIVLWDVGKSANVCSNFRVLRLHLLDGEVVHEMSQTHTFSMTKEQMESDAGVSSNISVLKP